MSQINTLYMNTQQQLKSTLHCDTSLETEIWLSLCVVCVSNALQNMFDVGGVYVYRVTQQMSGASLSSQSLSIAVELFIRFKIIKMKSFVFSTVPNILFELGSSLKVGGIAK